MSALSIASAGMNAAASRLNVSASNIARVGTPLGKDVDMASEVVDVVGISAQFEILAAVARKASEMTKAGIDILV
jgi:flagellar basal body rod protein FlgC